MGVPTLGEIKSHISSRNVHPARSPCFFFPSSFFQKQTNKQPYAHNVLREVCSWSINFEAPKSTKIRHVWMTRQGEDLEGDISSDRLRYYVACRRFQQLTRVIGAVSTFQSLSGRLERKEDTISEMKDGYQKLEDDQKPSASLD